MKKQLLTVLFAAGMSVSGQAALLPPNANFQGKSLTEWSVLASASAIDQFLGDPPSLPDMVGRVRLLPLSPVPGPVSFHINLAPGTAMAGPAWFLAGELYDDGTENDPAAPVGPDINPDNPDQSFEDFYFETTWIETRLNGRVLLQGFAADLGEFRFGPVHFDEPIFYDEPAPRGEDLNAVAISHVYGIGAVYHPLPVGEHTLVITVIADGWQQTATYHITVAPPGRGR